MIAVIVRKTFENHDKNFISSLINYILTLNKFILKIFNQLFCNKKINKLLIASFLLDLSNYYFLKINIKIIDII